MTDKEFWKDIIYKDGKLDEEAILKELSDYSYILDQVPIVYCHVTHDRLSYANYPAKTVIAEHDELFWDKGWVKDDIAQMINTKEYTLEDLKAELKEYFEIS